MIMRRHARLRPEICVGRLASGKSADGHQTISLDESLNFPDGSDLSGVTAVYDDDGRLVIRIPKTGLKHT